MESRNSVLNYPSIFNDVIGPVMRGPSSSHCAASVRIGRIARALMDGELKEIEIEYDTNGSLAFTHVSQGSDMGIFGGFLGWDATDERLVDSAKEIRKAGISVDIKIRDFGAEHPNTYKLSLKNPNEQHTMTALSTGGGMIEVIEIDGARVSIAGDYYETLIFIGSGAEAILEHITENVRADEINLLKGDAIRYIEIKSQKPLDDKTLSDLQSGFDIKYTRTISPVLPMLSRKQIKVPFTNTAELLKYNEGKQLEFWELATHYEAARGNIADDEVFEKMRNIVEIMETSIEAGIQGTHHEDRILGYQSGAFLESMERGKLFDGGILNRMILFTTAMMEMKSAMGVIVAAPTAGSCGVLPGAVIGAAKEMGLSTDDKTRAMLAAGLLGVLIAARSTFAAEVCGCQAECGAGSGMAAAALVQLAGGTAQQAVDAASMALQNTFGMICDPVANRVEVPCLGKNIMAVSNALACANMAMANFDAVIPLDEVIDAMDRVGKRIPHELRCTALGGLSITKTSKEIEKKLDA